MSQHSSGRTCPNGEDRPLLSRHSDLVTGADFNVEQNEHCEAEDLVRKKAEEVLLRKVDIRMSILVLLVLLSYIDRSNAASARLRGFEEDLGLKGTQFSTIISALYVGYVLMQVPSNMILSQIGKPSVYLSCCVMVSGGVTFCTGLTRNYHEAFMTRLILGFVEAPLFSGAMFFLGKWYKRHELSERMAYLIFGGLISIAFGSLIASGLLDMMDGVLGYTGWRWLFFVEGGLAILVSSVALFILPDLPQAKSISWLTDAEHTLAKERMVEDAAHTSSPTDDAASGLLLAMADWKVYFMALSAFLTTVTLSFMIYFPTLTSTMGYSPTITMLLCIPPWVTAAFFGLWHSKHSDRTGERCMHVIIPLGFAVSGFFLAMSTMNTALRYASLYLMAQAAVSDVCFYAWISSTFGESPAKRAVAFAFINALAQCGNVVGSYVWMKEWGPTYDKSFVICTTTCLGSILMCLYLRKVLRTLNHKMDMESERCGEVHDGGWRYHF